MRSRDTRSHDRLLLFATGDPGHGASCYGSADTLGANKLSLPYGLRSTLPDFPYLDLTYELVTSVTTSSRSHKVRQMD